MKRTYTFDNGDTQLYDHKGFTVNLQVDELTGGWFAIANVYVDLEDGERGKNKFHKTVPAGFGFTRKADAKKALTQLKRECRECIEFKEEEQQ